MNVLYNSANYTVVEFPGRGGIELLDKTTRRAGSWRAQSRSASARRWPALRPSVSTPNRWTNSSATTRRC